MTENIESHNEMNDIKYKYKVIKSNQVSKIHSFSMFNK